MMREGIPKGRASMSTRGKSDVDMRLKEEIEEAERSGRDGV